MAQLGVSKPRLSNLIKAELMPEHGYCRKTIEITLSSETNLSIGSVLGVVTATGAYALRDPDATDGSEVAAAVVIQNVTVPASVATSVAVLYQGAAIVGDEALVFDVAHTAPQKATAISEIEALGIKVGEQV